VDFAAGLAAELGDDRAGAPDEAAHDGRVAHEAERDLPREHLEDRTLGSVGVCGGRALTRRRGFTVVAVIGVGSGGVLHCVVSWFQRGTFFHELARGSRVSYLDGKEGTRRVSSYKVWLKVKDSCWCLFATDFMQWKQRGRG